MGDHWWFVEQFEWVLIDKLSFVLQGILGDFAGYLGAVAGPPSSFVPLAFVFLAFCKEFKAGKSEIEVKWK